MREWLLFVKFLQLKPFAVNDRQRGTKSIKTKITPENTSSKRLLHYETVNTWLLKIMFQEIWIPDATILKKVILKSHHADVLYQILNDRDAFWQQATGPTKSEQSTQICQLYYSGRTTVTSASILSVCKELWLCFLGCCDAFDGWTARRLRWIWQKYRPTQSYCIWKKLSSNFSVNFINPSILDVI